MRLSVTTPTAVVLECDGVHHVRAEDDSGAFGILPGHADFLTALAVSVVDWTGADGRIGHVAVRGGVLRVAGGERIEIASREAICGDDLEVLESDVIERFRRDEEDERRSRHAATRLELSTLRYLRRYLRPGERRHRPVPAENGPHQTAEGGP